MDGERTITPQDKAETMSGDSSRRQLVNKLLCDYYTAAHTAHQIPDYTAHNHTTQQLFNRPDSNANCRQSHHTAADPTGYGFYYFCCDAFASFSHLHNYLYFSKPRPALTQKYVSRIQNNQSSLRREKQKHRQKEKRVRKRRWKEKGTVRSG